MIKIITNEYVENNIAIKEIFVTFLNISIFKHIMTSTDNVVVNQLIPIKERTKIKGFKNENKD